MTWEYRCVKFPFPWDFTNVLPFKDQYADLPGKHTDLLNELGAEGWEWIHAEKDLFYFRRPKQLSKEKLEQLMAQAWKTGPVLFSEAPHPTAEELEMTDIIKSLDR